MALQKLARWYREQLEVVVIGITGSNGKTTTKDFCASVIGQRHAVHATRGNLNNHIGLPLTLLEADDTDEVLVVEMGMNHPGEIAPLCEIAKPQIGIITNIGHAHIEFMGSKEAIAEEKGALARSLPEVGTLLITAGCEFAEYFSSRSSARSIPVGNGRGVIRAESLRTSGEGSFFDLVIDGERSSGVHLKVAGRHMVNNALLAAGAGWVLGLSPDEISRGLEVAPLTGGRLRCFERGGITIYDDTYNANPDSTKESIDLLSNYKKQTTLVLGDMLELGKYKKKLHREVGEYANAKGIDFLLGYGDLTKHTIASFGNNGFHFENEDDLKNYLKENITSKDVILIKGSRGMRMERFINV